MSAVQQIAFECQLTEQFLGTARSRLHSADARLQREQRRWSQRAGLGGSRSTLTEARQLLEERRKSLDVAATIVRDVRSAVRGLSPFVDSVSEAIAALRADDHDLSVAVKLTDHVLAKLVDTPARVQSILGTRAVTSKVVADVNAALQATVKARDALTALSRANDDGTETVEHQT